MPMRNSAITWVFPELLDIPSSFQSTLGYSSVVSQALFRRGLTSTKSAQGFLDPDFFQPTPAAQLPGLKLAAERLESALSLNEIILVWGDFDVDGQTSTSLLVSALRDLGGDVHHYIPNRARESHGMSTSSLSSQIEIFRPSLILTCDTGIDAFEPIEHARNQGIDVIITDHHQLPQVLPNAYAIINPNMLPSEHPLSTLPGVGVAFKLIEHLYNLYGKNVDHLLDLVALGIVADVAPLYGDTRYLLQRGLPILRNTSRLGLRQLYINAKLDGASISEDQIGFVIGPRLNALGRLADANSCVDFFTTNDQSHAANLAAELENLNLKRRELTEVIFQDAIAKVETNPDLVEDYPILVLLGPPNWNPGVIGIVASRLVDRFHKPVIMLTEEGDNARGSARSIPGVPISDLIASASDILINHGGHPMAAGVKLHSDRVSEFRRTIAHNFKGIVGESLPSPQVQIDTLLPFQSISIDFINDFHRLSPFGSGNPKLLFASRGVKLITDKIIGKDRNHRKLTLEDSAGTKQDVLWWNSVGIDLPESVFDIAYSLVLSNYNRKSQPQLTLQHFRNSKDTPILLKDSKEIKILDFRKQTDPLTELGRLVIENPSSIIWAECNTPSGINCLPREDLVKSPTLIIWTTPPSPSVLKNVLDSVSPKSVFLFAEDPMPQTNRSVLQAILGLLKHLRDTGKPYDPVLFAQSIGQTPALIELGITWLHEHGDHDLSHLKSNQIISGGGSPLPGFAAIDYKFNLLLHEISSYRYYYKHAKKEYLL
ncbi:MAG: single-stranded-DNA-specific exonuclease RecJ [Anaerolineales bacterium]|nr:single-stranded-DNA-specific exonuclease RecJ [Anaerolineales bacterium]